MAVPVRLHLLVGQLSGGGESSSPNPPLREVAIWSAGNGGPRCKEGKLFHGWLTVAERYGQCGLEPQYHEKGDSPAFFAIVIIGTLVCALVVAIELLYAPPYWLYAMLWLPVALLGSLFCLRWVKGIIIAIQYKHRVDEFAHDD